MQALQTNVADRKPFSAAELGLSKPAYTISEVLELLPFGRTKLYELIAAEELPLIRFGKRVSIATPDIVALINRRRETA